MVDKKDILSLGYLALAPFTGSDASLRYRIEKVNVDGEDYLQASAWNGPFSFDNTPEEEIRTKQSDFSDDGVQLLVDWLNEGEVNESE